MENEGELSIRYFNFLWLDLSKLKVVKKRDWFWIIRPYMFTFDDSYTRNGQSIGGRAAPAEVDKELKDAKEGGTHPPLIVFLLPPSSSHCVCWNVLCPQLDSSHTYLRLNHKPLMTVRRILCREMQQDDESLDDTSSKSPTHFRPFTSTYLSGVLTCNITSGSKASLLRGKVPL